MFGQLERIAPPRLVYEPEEFAGVVGVRGQFARSLLARDENPVGLDPSSAKFHTPVPLSGQFRGRHDDERKYLWVFKPDSLRQTARLPLLPHEQDDVLLAVDQSFQHLEPGSLLVRIGVHRLHLDPNPLFENGVADEKVRVFVRHRER